MSKSPPRVSFGLPVRNGQQTVRRCLESILAQDFQDFEVVVSDNASTDETRAILEEYAARDPRVRLFENPENIGQIANVNRVFELSEGEYFRWIGSDDWLEPQYARRCVETLDNDRSAIAVTTYFRTHDDEGGSFYEEYQGERLESERPEQRFARMLWFFHGGDRKYDPLYSMMRREVLGRTALIRMMACADWMLAAELSLLGRFLHVPECLSHRRKPYETLSNRARHPTLMRRYHPTRYAELPSSPGRLLGVLLSVIQSAELTIAQRLICLRAAVRFFLIELYRRSCRYMHGFRRERLGLTRENLPFLRRNRQRRRL